MIKPFERQGNYTAVDNAVLDHLMSELSGNEFKILMAIVRRTIGWHEEEAGISQREFKRITGIASFDTVANALARLVALGIVIRQDVGQRANYALNRDYELKTAPEIGAVTAPETGAATAPEIGAVTAPKTGAVFYIEKKGKKGRGSTRAIPPPQSPEESEIFYHPAVMAWIDNGFEWPGYENAPVIIHRLGDEPDRDLLRQAKQFWNMSGYRGNNLIGILDWYAELLNDPNWSPGPISGNGRAPRVPIEKAPAAW